MQYYQLRKVKMHPSRHAKKQRFSCHQHFIVVLLFLISPLRNYIQQLYFYFRADIYCVMCIFKQENKLNF